MVRKLEYSDIHPLVCSEVFKTEAGTLFLRQPGVATLSIPDINISAAGDYLTGYGVEFGFDQYLNDPGALSESDKLCKFAGQLCYGSFGPKRTWNRDASGYFANIKSSGHGSVLEHASFTFLFYGIDRSVTHELVRHRAGFAFSQVSQRYVDGKMLRFVERPEFQGDEELHATFMKDIDLAAASYENRARLLLARQQAGSGIMSADRKTDLRKRVNQAARSVLPNETEAPIVVSANARGWRHFLEMRANPQAEVQIRSLAFPVYQCLKEVAPLLFEDYRHVVLSDGTNAVETEFRKV
jgi:thymidylate synthase (FAD)